MKHPHCKLSNQRMFSLHITNKKQRGCEAAASLTSSSGDGGSGMGMSRGAWSEDMSVMLRLSSCKEKKRQNKRDVDQ